MVYFILTFSYVKYAIILTDLCVAIFFSVQWCRMVSQSPGKVAFLKHAIRIHAALRRPSMAYEGFKKATLPGDSDRIHKNFILYQLVQIT